MIPHHPRRRCPGRRPGGIILQEADPPRGEHVRGRSGVRHGESSSRLDQALPVAGEFSARSEQHRHAPPCWFEHRMHPGSPEPPSDPGHGSESVQGREHTHLVPDKQRSWPGSTSQFRNDSRRPAHFTGSRRTGKPQRSGVALDLLEHPFGRFMGNQEEPCVRNGSTDRRKGTEHNFVISVPGRPGHEQPGIPRARGDGGWPLRRGDPGQDAVISRVSHHDDCSGGNSQSFEAADVLLVGRCDEGEGSIPRRKERSTRPPEPGTGAPDGGRDQGNRDPAGCRLDRVFRPEISGGEDQQVRSQGVQGFAHGPRPVIGQVVAILPRMRRGEAGGGGTCPGGEKLPLRMPVPEYLPHSSRLQALTGRGGMKPDERVALITGRGPGDNPARRPEPGAMTVAPPGDQTSDPGRCRDHRAGKKPIRRAGGGHGDGMSPEGTARVNLVPGASVMLPSET